MGFGRVVYPSFLLTRSLAAMAGAMRELNGFLAGTGAPPAPIDHAAVSAELQAVLGLDTWQAIEEYPDAE